MEDDSIMKDDNKTATDRPPAKDASINGRIAGRVAELRSARGLSLDALAQQSDVSRSMISVIERGEANPTAVVLEKLAAGLGVPLASLFDTARAAPGPLVRRTEQSEWRDPASGYLRRNVSPPDHPSPLRIVEVEFPAGKRVVLEGSTHANAIDEQVWMLEGAMAVTIGGTRHRLAAGDCLALHVDAPIEFHNPTRRPARYAVVIATAPSNVARHRPMTR